MSSAKQIGSLQGWRDSAPFWEKHAAAIRTMFAPVSDALVEAAGLRSSDAVLDLAGGPGEPSLSIARRSDQTGWVACTDAIAPMVQSAAARARSESLQRVYFVQCVGDRLPFRANSFDAVICRFGIMFFDEPLTGLEEIVRVLKPGGGLALAVWGTPDANPYFRIPLEVIRRHVALPAIAPDAPGAFRFAEPGKLAALVRRAGALGVEERPTPFRIEASVGFDGFWTLRAELSETLREMIAGLEAHKLRAVVDEVKTAVAPYFADHKMCFPSEAMIVLGRKPAHPNPSKPSAA